MADPNKTRRFAKRIGTVVAQVIHSQVKDPQLEFVTITDVKVTNDLHDATVYYTVRGVDLQTPPDYAGAAASLRKITGMLRSTVGAATGVRFTPTLRFEVHELPAAATHMEEMLTKAREADARVAQTRQYAHYAGDPDPYKKSEDALGQDESGCTG